MEKGEDKTMINNVIVSDELQKSPEKKEGYDRSICDFDYLLSGELTVTITLSEYRWLLTASANAKTNEANSRRYESDRKLEETKKELEAVKKQLADLRAMFAGAALEAATVKKEAETDE